MFGALIARFYDILALIGFLTVLVGTIWLTLKVSGWGRRRLHRPRPSALTRDPR